MTIGRRELLFGGALLGVGAGASTSARACSLESPGTRFFPRLWYRGIIFPYRSRTLTRRFVDGVLERSAEKIAGTLAEDAKLFVPPSGDHPLQAGRVLQREEAIAHLLRIVDRAGARSAPIRYSSPPPIHSRIFADVVLTGSGPSLSAPAEIDPSLRNPYGIGCSVPSNDWQHRIIWMLDMDARGDPSAGDIRIRGITQLTVF